MSKSNSSDSACKCCKCRDSKVDWFSLSSVFLALFAIGVSIYGINVANDAQERVERLQFHGNPYAYLEMKADPKADPHWLSVIIHNSGKFAPISVVHVTVSTPDGKKATRLTPRRFDKKGPEWDGEDRPRPVKAGGNYEWSVDAKTETDAKELNQKLKTLAESEMLLVEIETADKKNYSAEIP